TRRGTLLQQFTAGAVGYTKETTTTLALYTEVDRLHEVGNARQMLLGRQRDDRSPDQIEQFWSAFSTIFNMVADKSYSFGITHPLRDTYLLFLFPTQRNTATSF